MGVLEGDGATVSPSSKALSVLYAIALLAGAIYLTALALFFPSHDWLGVHGEPLLVAFGAVGVWVAFGKVLVTLGEGQA